MSNEENALLVQLEPTSARDFFTDAAKVGEVINKIRSIATNDNFDAATAKGRAEIKSLAYKIKRSKTYLDEAGKDLVSELKELPKLIDSNRKTIRDELDAIHDQVRKPLTDWEEAEARKIREQKEAEERAEIARAKILDITQIPLAYINAPSAKIRAAIGTMEVSELVVDSFGDLFEEARVAKVQAIEKLRQMAEAAEVVEKHQQEERDRLIAEQAVAREREAAKQAIIEANMAAHRAEAERKAAEQRAIDAEANRKAAEIKAADDERQRIKAEQEAVRRAEEARARDVEHKGRIHREAVACLTVHAGITDDQAKAVVVAIAKRQIPHISINY